MIAHAMRQARHCRPLLTILAALSVLCLIWLIYPPYSSFSWPDVSPEPSPQRIAKVSMLYGRPNRLYERALQSHTRHAQRWGYPMHILREDISVGFWNKPSYLLSLVIGELAKPPGKRVEWLMWVDADSIILNGAIPADLFIPPSDLKDIHLVATKDHNGLNTGIMFLHIHPWTINMLVESLAYPLYLPNETLGRSMDQESMARVLNQTTGGPKGEGYVDGLVYVPRTWINTYEWTHAYEGKRGNLLVHFPGLEEHRWSHMSKWLDIVEITPTRWEVPLEETQYLNETTAFWTRVRTAMETMALMEKKIDAMPNKTDSQRGEIERIDVAVRALRKALHEEADNVGMVQERLDYLSMFKQ
ncbi:uncharacterized protein ACLA_003900 [Aspergillus clavatus NRRL 1]|uniref:Galactosyl transferase GMA12/MNN10 family protein n=1 Tax=Aspergillus clavatus (strain ATCC 1007 / CBS 513.65 / DSM 816 / NCTC 3887 / NRRL 1 / QM 1276 / 107) TaxID=344612 RepID=A1C5K9_ASPCL|nr:uncharacterized protein ACLA_003900 [Aspergillus clavatus NRRL 1]EAW14977.1 hypothetical protein ACLA_003900 [Aspergillus clavatus NRRL 1]